jgi:hypothetical protein
MHCVAALGLKTAAALSISQDACSLEFGLLHWRRIAMAPC